MFFFIIPSGESYCNDRSKEFSENKNIYERRSFRPGEITLEEANRLGLEFAKRFAKGNHAFVVCTHIDKSHIHNHIIWSSVSLEYDRKFRNFWGIRKAGILLTSGKSRLCSYRFSKFFDRRYSSGERPNCFLNTAANFP